VLALLLACAATAFAAPRERGEALVAVKANMQSNESDLISLRIRNNADSAVLQTIASELSRKFRAQPINVNIRAGDPDMINGQSLGLDMCLPVVPRGEGYLPIAPFIEAFAPYASSLQIVYIISGPFTYHGYQSYSNPDVSFTVDPPEISPTGTGIPLAFYGVNVTIANSSLTSVPAPHDPLNKHVRTRGHLPIWVIIVIAGLLGAGIGFLAIKFMPKQPPPPRKRRRPPPAVRASRS